MKEFNQQDFEELKKELIEIQNQYQKDMAEGKISPAHKSISRNKEDYLINTIGILGVQSVEDDSPKFTNWLYSHLSLGNENKWLAFFNSYCPLSEINQNPVLKALTYSNDNDLIINFGRDLSTKLFNKGVISELERKIKHNNGVGFVFVTENQIMVKKTKNPILNLSTRFPGKFQIFKMETSPNLSGTLLLDKNNNPKYQFCYGFHEWSDDIRSSIEPVYVHGTILKENGFPSPDSLMNLIRINEKKGNFVTRQEKEFTFNNWFKEELMKKF